MAVHAAQGWLITFAASPNSASDRVARSVIPENAPGAFKIGPLRDCFGVEHCEARQ
jgi:hypothetical protein